MLNKKISVVLCIALLIVSVSGCGLRTEEPDSQVIPDETSATEGQSESESIIPEEVVVESVSDGSAHGYFSTTDLSGNEVTQEIFTESKLTVVNVWATYCGPCINEMPYLGELAEEYDSAEVQIIGIPSDVISQDYLDYAKTLIEQTGADYTHLLPTEEVYNWGLYDIQYVPTTFFVNSEGEIVDTVVGSMSKEDWKTLIDDKLASL